MPFPSLRALLRTATLSLVALAAAAAPAAAPLDPPPSTGERSATRAPRAPGTTATDLPAIDEARLCADLAELASDAMNGRSFRSEDGKRAAAWVADRFADAGLSPLEGRDGMLVPIGRAPDAAPNVVGWLPPKGPAPTGEFILVGAHFDHLPNARSGDDRIFNGADDNASGVAGMIAVARALRDARLNAGVVFVAFTGEEAGLVGSRAFVEEETLPVARIRGLFNMDMISRQPDGAIRLDGGPVGKPLVALLERLAPSVPIAMKVDTHPDWLPRSDQAAFLAAGVPSVLFSCEDHEDYHQVTDHADRADCALAARVATLVALAVPAWSREMPSRFDLSPALDDDGRARRAIRVGRTMPNAPYWTPATRRNPGRGIDADLVAALAKETGWTFEEKSVKPEAAIGALAAGEVDLVVNGASVLSISGADAAKVAAIEPAYLAASGVALLVRQDSAIATTEEGNPPALAGLRIAVRTGSAAASHFSRAHPGLATIAVDAPDGAIATRVEKGELDAFAGDALALEARARRDPAFRVVRLASLGTVVLRRTDDTALGAAVGRAIEALRRSGALGEIAERHGAVRHAVLGQDRGKLTAIAATGETLWRRDAPHNAHDIDLAERDGRPTILLHAAPNRIDEIDLATGATVWSWTSRAAAPYDGPVEIHGFERLDDGATMVAETGNLRIVEVAPDGTIRRTVPIRTDRPDWHHDTRRVRTTPTGTYLVCHEPLGLVREYDATGAIVWEYALPLAPGREASPGQQGHGTAVFHALRLPNGNTLVGGGNNNRVLEVNPAKEIVRAIGPELAGPDGGMIALRWVTSLQVLPNGNIVIGNTHGGPGQPQLVEVTREGKVVWTFRDWTNFGNDLCAAWCLDLPDGTLR